MKNSRAGDSNGISPERVAGAVKRARAAAPAEGAAADVAAVFKALSDPTRVRILHALASGEICVKAVAEALGISQSLASHHLRLMWMMGLLNLTRHGRMCCYSLASRRIAKILDEAGVLADAGR